ncbi:phosphate ABC transporter substrate-binding protein [Massilia cavernae]|uniref:Phosphate ABC transporter substrate-binding protein n=1 Tax=Massilia cavernae TaxID=2320864 RepID=A0A418X6W1_9BURK|nr:phosphate ABC transporter substrate-binding protein [Massilia cavernae]RJG08234.1 phosphate ABC transporter substrate-binding protein [Massilia cavernae]
MRLSTLRFLLAAAVFALSAPAASAAELVVIVSARNPVAAMRPDQVADIFLGHAGRFPDGAEAVPFDQAIGSPLRDDFYAKVAAKTPPLLKAYWTKMIFTGRGKPPRELPNSAAIRKEVAKNPALIGYIDKASLDASVRPVLVVR